MHLAMMTSAQGDGELITHFAPKRPILREAQVVGIAGASPANQTRLHGHVSDVIAVAYAARLRHRECAFFDPFGSRALSWLSGLKRAMRRQWLLSFA
jgi:hypothetical protein